MQQRYCCKQGRTLLSSAAVRYQLWFGQDQHLWALGCYLLVLYLYSSAVGGRHSNEFPAWQQYPTVAYNFSDYWAYRTLNNCSSTGLWFFIRPSSFSIGPGRTYIAEHLRKGYRFFKVNSHLIFYITTDFELDVIRILHSQMDIPNRIMDW